MTGASARFADADVWHSLSPDEQYAVRLHIAQTTTDDPHIRACLYRTLLGERILIPLLKPRWA